MRILFYPEKPKEFAMWENKVRTYCTMGDIEMTDNPDSDYDAVMFWSYERYVWNRDEAYHLLRDIMINKGCYDSTKTHNEASMLAAFGYCSMVDDSYDGVILKKANRQCAHDMTVVDKVGANDNEFIYVKQIDNRINDNTVMDYRIFYFDGIIPLVITKAKPLKDRYAGAGESELMLYDRIHYVLSKDEMDGIDSYCRHYGSHITELDAIRDIDGRLYIVDNNNIAGQSNIIKQLLTDRRQWEPLADVFKYTVEKFIR